MVYSFSHDEGVYIARGIIFLVGMALYVLGMLNARELLKIFGSFFSAVSHPVNLAIFRIVIFYYLWGVSFSSKAVFFSGLPKVLLYRIRPVTPGARQATFIFKAWII